MPCKGICIRHKVVGPYANGHKRCKECGFSSNEVDYGVRAAGTN